MYNIHANKHLRHNQFSSTQHYTTFQTHTPARKLTLICLLTIWIYDSKSFSSTTPQPNLLIMKSLNYELIPNWICEQAISSFVTLCYIFSRLPHTRTTLQSPTHKQFHLYLYIYSKQLPIENSQAHQAKRLFI